MTARGIQPIGQEVDLDVLAGLARSGKSGALLSLAAHIRPMILRYCRARLGSGALGGSTAEDIAQETLLAVVEALDAWKPQQKFMAFVYGIVSNKVLDAYRAAGATKIPKGSELQSARSEQERTAHSTVDVGKLSEQLRLISAGEREVLILRVAVGLSAEETAEVLGITPAKVRSVQHRAIRSLRESVDSGEQAT
jgi:RNA polymerase sigma-70 factor (ECF subfamily)